MSTTLSGSGLFYSSVMTDYLAWIKVVLKYIYGFILPCCCYTGGRVWYYLMKIYLPTTVIQ